MKQKRKSFRAFMRTLNPFRRRPIIVTIQMPLAILKTLIYAVQTSRLPEKAKTNLANMLGKIADGAIQATKHNRKNGQIKSCQ